MNLKALRKLSYVELVRTNLKSSGEKLPRK